MADTNQPVTVSLTASERWALTKAILSLQNMDSPELTADPEWTNEVEQDLERVFKKLNPLQE